VAAGGSQRLPHRGNSLRLHLPVAIATLGWATAAFGFNDVYQRDALDTNSLRIAESAHLGREVPDVAVTTESGTQRLSTLMAGQPTVLLLAYYTCGHSCPAIITNLSRLPIGTPTSAYRVIVVSFDDKDNLNTLRHVKSSLPRLPDNWTFGLLSAEESDRLTASIGFKFVFSERDQIFVHPAVLTLLSPERQVMRYLYGAEPRAADVELGLIESRTGTPHLNEIVDMFKLTCFHFDASRSRYVLHPTVILGGAGIGVLGIAGLAALAYKKDSKGVT
jgi:protein SCO1/2